MEFLLLSRLSESHVKHENYLPETQQRNDHWKQESSRQSSCSNKKQEGVCGCEGVQKISSPGAPERGYDHPF